MLNELHWGGRAVRADFICFDLINDLRTGVKCRATYKAKKLGWTSSDARTITKIIFKKYHRVFLKYCSSGDKEPEFHMHRAMGLMQVLKMELYYVHNRFPISYSSAALLLLLVLTQIRSIMMQSPAQRNKM